MFRSSSRRRFWQIVALIMLAGLGLQIWFFLRIAFMQFFDPGSTSFERTEIRRLLALKGWSMRWQQQWQDYENISLQLKRAVIASEDGEFVEHSGVDWEAMEAAWERNAQAQAQAQQRAARLQAQQERLRKAGKIVPPKAQPMGAEPPAVVHAKVVGGSTITQQLAKNLFLSGERQLLRKGQELVIAWMLEAVLDKRRIYEIYLNHVEWGEGVFGAQAAAQRYYRKSAQTLSTLEAARLAVMLPRPRYFEARVASPWLASRAAKIASRMAAVEVP